MNFNSVEFIVFFPLVLLLGYLLPQKFRWIMLLIASYYFYISWNFQLIYLILFTTIVSYIAGLVMERSKNKAVRTATMTVTLVVCLGILFFYKYFDFLAVSVTDLLRAFSVPAKDFTLNLLLPVGISFYTFQTLSYVIDVYRGLPAEKHFGYYALFVSFFPQLVAGPIERPDNLLPQLKVKYKPQKENFSEGAKMMLAGFFKKIVVADFVSNYVTAVYGDPASANGLGVTIATCLFAVQIYCDFSGYTDIAIGAARMMGIRLMQNFDRPYIAKSISEFWRRWHISLSSWFKDYLYFPLGGSRCSTARCCFNLAVVFIVSGLWHGAAWTFVIWGVLHAFYQVVERLLRDKRKAFDEKAEKKGYGRVLGAARTAWTFILVTFAWIFFRAGSVADLRVLLSALFTKWSFSADYFAQTLDHMGITLTGTIITVLSIITMSLIDRVKDKESKAAPLCEYGKNSRVITAERIYLVWIVASAWLLLLSSGGESAFIYFQF